MKILYVGIMRKAVTLLVPACYPDIFAQFLDSYQKYAERWPFTRKILIRDEQHITTTPHGWEVIQGPSPYAMPRNINLGLAATGGLGDVVIASDDTQFTEKGSLEELQDVAYRYSDTAIVSPQIDGGCGIPEQKISGGNYIDLSVLEVAFIFVYLKRAVIDVIGGWDEQFTTHGHDDYDYCRRVRGIGRRICVTSSVIIKHGFHSPAANTYMRKGQADTAEGARIFERKWGNHQWTL